MIFQAYRRIFTMVEAVKGTAFGSALSGDEKTRKTMIT
jgi:hypothetical protein